MPIRRDRIPPKPEMPYDLWKIVKQFASREITGISIPVNYCEPLSMLQRMTEDFEYVSALDLAADIEDPGEQHAHVAAFSVSAYAGTVFRTGKPFNPLLNETFEFDRTSEMGWRAISEQVTHHPPRSATYIEGKRWKAWQDYGLVMRYRGNYILINPEGMTHVKFDSGNYYTWGKVLTKINNVIIGAVWIDQSGTCEIINHTNGSKCELTFMASSTRSSKRKVQGTVVSSSGEDLWIVRGQWDRGMYVYPAISPIASTSSFTHERAATAVVWERTPLPLESPFCYHFGTFASQLNEPETGVAPTDSRNRPDIRLFENGDWEEANPLKCVLEEKQRGRLRDQSREPDPLWFKLEKDSITGKEGYVYGGDYWECKEKKDWSRCPEIF